MRDGRVTPRLVALAVVAFGLFNYPLLHLFDVPVIVLGLPLVWLYVFVSWGVLILLVGLTMRDR